MTQSTTIGCDLGDRESHLCVIDENGQMQRARVKTNRVAMRAWFTRPAAHVVIEVGTHSRWVQELLTELGHRVTVANPRRVQLIAQGNSKSDTTDAELLARLGRADAELLSPVQHRGKQAQTDRAMIKTRDVLVACRTRLVNHARSVVKSCGERLPRCNAENFQRKTWECFPEELKTAFEPMYKALEAIDEEIKTLDDAIEQVATKYPDVKVISQPNGVGVLTALAFVLTIENKDRFAKSRMAGAFVGLRPKKKQSGDADPQQRITKTGDPLLRRLLVNSANYTLGPFGRDSDLRRWGLSLASRGGKNAKKRATVAVARKLAVLMHRLWVTGEVYEPIGYRERRQMAA